MFLDIGETPFALPMDKYRLDKILKKYKSEMIKEIKNELIAHLPRSVVDDAITIITRNNKEIGIEYSDFQNYIRKVIPPESELTVDMVIERLYDSSIIGQIKDGRNFFKYRQGEREEEAHLHDFEIGQKILAHNIARL
ncbi:hypothetical protein [Chromobacterium subtsugae]|uniref:hypothetical protein n=1 Tax=Chromobacterium subtsugae TaxID=251747 RepID=UPI0012FF5DEA|nr:hypothetical protein [Chromobacterium subtsugae]